MPPTLSAALEPRLLRRLQRNLFFGRAAAFEVAPRVSGSEVAPDLSAIIARMPNLCGEPSESESERTRSSRFTRVRKDSDAGTGAGAGAGARVSATAASVPLEYMGRHNHHGGGKGPDHCSMLEAQPATEKMDGDAKIAWRKVHAHACRGSDRRSVCAS